MKKVIVALAVLIAAGCSNGPEQGEVRDKSVDPAYTYIQMQCFSYNAQGMCTSQVPIPVYVPEVYYLYLYNNVEDQGKRSVPYEIWAECAVDMSYYREGKCHGTV